MYPTSVIALFCDDVREEKSGAFTLVGILPDNANIPPLPADIPEDATGMMPRLCIYLRAHFDPKNELGHFSTKIVFPDGTEREVSAVDDETVAKARKETLEKGNLIAAVFSRIEMSPFPVMPGRMRVEMTIGSETYVCGSLNFAQEPVSAGPTP